MVENYWIFRPAIILDVANLPFKKLKSNNLRTWNPRNSVNTKTLIKDRVRQNMKLELLSLKPVESKFTHPLLFIHGSWHGAWCWEENFMPYFAEKGIECHAMSFRGHGKSEGHEKIKWYRINDYVDDLRRTIESFSETPVLVGHSMGAMVIQKYLEKHEVPACVLAAPVPSHGALLSTLRFLFRHPLAFLKTNLTMNLYPVVGSPQLAGDTLFSRNFPQKKLESYHSRMQTESFISYLDTLLFNLPDTKQIKTRMQILGGADDRLVGPGELLRMSRIYGAQLNILPNLAHNLMLDDGWKRVANTIIDWLYRLDKNPKTD